MKKIIPLLAIFAAMPAFAVANAGRAGRAMINQMNAGPRATASVNQLQAMSSTRPGITGSTSVSGGGATSGDDVASGDDNGGNVSGGDVTTPTPDMREQEKAACINNNIGIGNTFVWASRYSNTGNYASMVEDLENPANNTCFVRVDMKSDDARISVADIPVRYYELGDLITCGSWADEDSLRQRILDAKKAGRTWATVGGVVGAAGVGVAAMELGVNRLIGGAVEGQKNKNLSQDELLRSQILAAKKDDRANYDKFHQLLIELRDECEKLDAGDRPDECRSYDFDNLLKLFNS